MNAAEKNPPLAEDKRLSRFAALEMHSVNAGELLRAVFPPQQWIVLDFIARSGAGILAGAPKLGKSWFALALALAVAAGALFLGFSTVQSAVLYLALEDGPRRLKNRLEKLKASQTGNLYFQTTWSQGQTALEDLDIYLEYHPEIQFFIIDTLQRFRGFSGAQDKYASDYETVSAIKSIADKHDATGLLIHHIRKQASEDPLERVSGTFGLTGAADFIFTLARVRGKDGAVLDVSGRDQEELNLALSFEDCVWSKLDCGPAIFSQTKERQAILEYLGKNGPSRAGIIAQAIGKELSVVSHLLKRLETENLVISPRYGEWSLPTVQSVQTDKLEETGLSTVQTVQTNKLTEDSNFVHFVQFVRTSGEETLTDPLIHETDGITCETCLYRSELDPQGQPRCPGWDKSFACNGYRHEA